MRKLTVFEKNEAESKSVPDSPSQKGTEGLLKASSFLINKPNLIEIGILDSEKIDDNGSKISALSDISTQGKFDEYLIEAIDESLTSLGTLVKKTIYFQLENSFNIPKNEIPNQVDEFTNIMHKIFGLGARCLEIKFMENLHSKIKVSIKMNEYEWPLSKWIVDDISFTEYVRGMRENYCSQR